MGAERPPNEKSIFQVASIPGHLTNHSVLHAHKLNFVHFQHLFTLYLPIHPMLTSFCINPATFQSISGIVLNKVLLFNVLSMSVVFDWNFPNCSLLTGIVNFWREFSKLSTLGGIVIF